MFKLLIDTCVWIDLAKDYQQQPLLGALEELIKHDQVSLILPRTVTDEFARNKTRTIEEGRQSLSSALKRVKDVVHKFGDGKNKTLVIEQLNDVDHRLPAIGDNVIESVARNDNLFKTAPIIETSDTVKLRAAQRAIEGRAPFHRQKNSINDAILIETYAEITAAQNGKGVRFAFVTHNIKDFSATNINNNLPHPDIASFFSKIKSLYRTKLGETLRRVEPQLFADIMIEQEWNEEPRRLKDILDAIDTLFHQVWYNRHWNLRASIEDGTHHVVAEKDYSRNPYRHDQTLDTIWAGALAAAKKTEQKIGLDNLGPWDDFEWGMINGKLSALRWVLGDEWDMLDT